MSSHCNLHNRRAVIGHQQKKAEARGDKNNGPYSEEQKRLDVTMLASLCVGMYIYIYTHTGSILIMVAI